MILKKPHMTGTRIPRMIFFAVTLAAVAQCVLDFPALPDRLASHFGASGLANGWMTKPQFFISYGLLFLPALFVEFLVGRKVGLQPVDRLRLPNKQYWLAPDRRAETIAYFESFFAWYGCAVLLVEVLAMGLAMHANFDAPPRLATGPIFAILSGFILFNVAAVISIFRRFSTPA
jgi:uncharacterized membrane protein